MTQPDATLAELVRRVVRDEIERALAPLLPPPLGRRQAALLDALAGVLGSSEFTAAEALQLARTPLADRVPLKAALQAVGADDAQRLGIVLGALERRSRGRPLRLARVATEGGSGVWCVEGT